MQVLLSIVCLHKSNPAWKSPLVFILEFHSVLRLNGHNQIIQAAKPTAKARPPVPGAAVAATPGVLETEAPDSVAAALSVSEDAVVALLMEFVDLALRRYY